MNWKDGWPVRVVAGLTAAYSVAITVSPRLLAKPCRLMDSGDSVPEPIAGLTRSMGTRDAVIALALATAPVGYPMSVLTAARVASDGADAIWFARMVPREQRVKVVGVASGWAGLQLLVHAIGNRRT